MKKVAIFGSSRTDPDSKLYAAVERLGKRCAQSGWTVVTGGGPGTMEAANKGASSVDLTRSEAEAIYLPFEEAVNQYVYDYTKHDDFFTRLDTFSNCDAFIVTPGGIGTLLEMAMIYQLVQVNHIEQKPIICVGRMWRTLKDWLEEEMVENGFLSNKEMDYIHYVDRFGEATALLNYLHAGPLEPTEKDYSTVVRNEEPTSSEIDKLMKESGMSWYESREYLRDLSYRGEHLNKPNNQSWGDFWKSY